MRKACHNILYTVVNSSAYENADTSTPAWIFILIAADIVLLALIALGFMKLTGSKKKNKKEIKKITQKRNILNERQDWTAKTGQSCFHYDIIDKNLLLYRKWTGLLECIARNNL